MTGTPKQLPWAEEIRANVIASFERFIQDIQNFDAPEEVKAQNISDCLARIEALQGAEDAGDIIGLFRDIRFTGNNETDFPKVMAVYRTTKPNTPGQHAILLK